MFPLDNLSRLIVGAIVEDAVDQLAIVSATFGPVPDTHFNDMKSSLETILVKLSEQEDGVGAGASDIKQLQCETAYLQKVLENCIGEVYEQGEVPSMVRAVEAYRRRLGEKDDIIIKEETVKTDIEHLTKELELLKETEVDTRKKEMRQIAQLKDSYLDSRRRAGSEESYILRQEEVKEQQKRTDLDTEEQHLNNRIKNLEMDIEHEERVTAEVESFLRDQHLEFSTKLTEWTQKYEEDTQRKKEELEAVIERRAEMLEKLKNQTLICAETEKFVAAVKAEKERLRKAKELEMKREKSAVKVQAWWRGIMVRCCLGQFRKNKVLRTKLMKIQKDRARKISKMEKH